MGKYFDKFPLVNYNGSLARNVIARVDFTEATKKDIYAQFDYEIEEGFSRPDLLSSNYYESPWYDWLIYMQNSIVDPYHDFYKSNEDFNAWIIAKYGSLESAAAKILFYRNDWASDDSEISPIVYDELPANIKKYYKPQVSITNQILGYKRLQEDWIRSTNRIIELTVTPEVVANFVVGDVIEQSSSSSKGTVATIDTENNKIMLQHITGEFAVSNAILDINYGPMDENDNYIWQIIPPDEAAFWAPVNAYEYEEEKNALKKHITMIKSSYLSDIDRLFQRQINR